MALGVSLLWKIKHDNNVPFVVAEKGSGDIVSIYRAVSACHDFHGMLIGKINTTFLFVIMLFSV